MEEFDRARPEPRLRVLIAGQGRSLFPLLRDPRLKVYPPEPAREPTPDLIVVPCSQLGILADPPPALPPLPRERIASGKAWLALDGSGEGYPHTPELAATLHRFAETFGAPAARTIYITQHRGFRDAYLAHTAETGAEPMTVLTYDLWIKAFFAPLETAGPDLFETRLADFRARSRARPRRFVSLNWTPRPAKAFFLLRLLQEGLWDQGYISFGGFEGTAIADKGGRRKLERDMRRLSGFEDLRPEIPAGLDRLEGLGRLTLEDLEPGEPAFGSRLASDRRLGEFGRSWFSVVTESEMSDQAARITEKPFKALVNFHPILVLGNPGALGRIRELGFRTFPDVVDESYDGEPDPRRRFEMVFAEVRRLCRLDEAELAGIEAGIADRLEHNARHGLTRLPRQYREDIDGPFVGALKRLRRPASAGG